MLANAAWYESLWFAIAVLGLLFCAPMALRAIVDYWLVVDAGVNGEVRLRALIRARDATARLAIQAISAATAAVLMDSTGFPMTSMAMPVNLGWAAAVIRALEMPAGAIGGTLISTLTLCWSVWAYRTRAQLDRYLNARS